ncbi:single-stranded DNA-binding protein [Staphylococcus sp. GDY8P83P]|uniref:single-stranded DNA-binding protein n=1 Tax=Staphylococcus sp. GDY8P83P TaxID=2804137 RepID=UPI001AEC18D3|nr:single-stranded DNA-binding protein [Staphylococcus sp. GDY8P83P]
MNIVAITGRITKDLELKQAGQTQVTNFSMAVENPYKKDDASFFDIVAFGKTAKLLNQYCGKGSKIGVDGTLKQDRFTDKEGNSRSVVRITANRIEFLDTKQSNNQSQQQKRQTKPQQQSSQDNPFANGGADISNSDLPF